MIISRAFRSLMFIENVYKINCNEEQETRGGGEALLLTENLQTHKWSHNSNMNAHNLRNKRNTIVSSGGIYRLLSATSSLFTFWCQ